MPVLLAKDDEAAWLDPDESATEAILSYLRPAPDGLLRSEAA